MNNKELHNFDLECHLLNALVDIPTAYDKYHARLHDGLFFTWQNQAIFNAIVRLKTANPLQTLDFTLVADELQHTSELEKIGEEYIAKVMASVSLASLDSLDTVISSLQEWHVLRNITYASHTAIEQSLDGMKASDIANQLIDTVSDTQRGNSQVTLHTPKTLFHGVINHMKNYQHGNDPFLYVGFVELSFKLSLVAGNLLVIAGRPSMGKTSLAMNMVTTIAKNHTDKTAIVFSLEMPADDLAKRMISSQSGVDLATIRGSKLATENDWGNIANAASILENLPLVIIDKPALTIHDVRIECQRIKRETKQDLSIIMIDYLQIMGGLNDDKGNKIDKIANATMILKTLAREYNCPVLLLSQLNRSLENRPDKRPINSDLRDSGTIEQDADIICMVYRDEVYRENSDHKGTAEILITKNRNGAIGGVRLGFAGEYCRFSDFIPDKK